MLKTATLISVLLGSLLLAPVALAWDDDSFEEEEAEASDESSDESSNESSNESSELTNEGASEASTEEASNPDAPSVETAAAETDSGEAKNAVDEADPFETAEQRGAGTHVEDEADDLKQARAAPPK